MDGEASVKVPNGKLVKVKVKISENRLEEVNIRGDFFIEPAEALHDLEENIENISVDTNREDLLDYINNVEAELIGFSSEDIVKAVREAIEDGDSE